MDEFDVTSDIIIDFVDESKKCDVWITMYAYNIYMPCISTPGTCNHIYV